MARTSGSHADKTGPRVRAVALKLFAQHGFAAVSMRQIAREVGVQAGALYLYTPDKQTLLFQLLQDHMQDLLAAPAAQGDPLTRLLAFCRSHIAFHVGRTDYMLIAYTELRSLNAENFAQIEGLRRRYEARLHAILEEGVDQQVFEIAEIRLATRAVIAMLNGVNTWYREGGQLSIDAVAQIYADMAARAVGAGQGALAPNP